MRFFSCILPIIIIIASQVLSCDEQIASKTPKIIIVKNPGYITGDTTISIGSKVKIRLYLENGDANLTYLGVVMDDGTRHSILDSGFNSSSLNYTCYIQKGPSATEKWIFIIMDKNRKKDSAQIVLTKSSISNYGKIIEYPVLFLGAQNNDTLGSFLSFYNGLVYDLSQAYDNQVLIDLVFYYGQYQGTFASPAEAEAPSFFTGINGISNWSIKNKTRYDTTTLSTSAFDAAENDSLLLAAFDPVNGKKKAKYLQKDMIFSFRSHDGKIGLIKIVSISGLEAGLIKFVVKIQE
jgi:hypothetical protein